MKKLAVMMILVAGLCIGFVAFANITSPKEGGVEAERICNFTTLYNQQGEPVSCIFPGNECCD